MPILLHYPPSGKLSPSYFAKNSESELLRCSDVDNDLNASVEKKTRPVWLVVDMNMVWTAWLHILVSKNASWDKKNLILVTLAAFSVLVYIDVDEITLVNLLEFSKLSVSQSQLKDGNIAPNTEWSYNWVIIK